VLRAMSSSHRRRICCFLMVICRALTTVIQAACETRPWFSRREAAWERHGTATSHIIVQNGATTSRALESRTNGTQIRLVAPLSSRGLLGALQSILRFLGARYGFGLSKRSVRGVGKYTTAARGGRPTPLAGSTRLRSYGGVILSHAPPTHGALMVLCMPQGLARALSAGRR